ncbi:HET-domain-containing protein [Parathielavia hyrcaniae]|uniref:HET-domain-containing protein n=1 Tax=Parathielavia hyrcaniae TaxID=113614 RepID=A0AAN6SYY9_9PEZI|nr:HET-domain-containing protein [Parathielavia hyrcaniae]
MSTQTDTHRYAPFTYATAKLSDAGAAGGAPEFRLLELLPSTTGNEPRCHIFVAEVDKSSQQYRALSYTWGLGPKDHSILVVASSSDAPNLSPAQPEALPITESLHTALLHFRQAREPVRLWIDQICINQDDYAEKGSQVGPMGSIYRNAQQVLVWLGPAAEHSDALMDAWQSIGQAARDWGLESYYTRERWDLLPPIAQNAEPSDPQTVAFQALMRTAAETFRPLLRARAHTDWFSRPWFSRAWIVQEFCLCPDTVFVCGTRTLPVELVMLALQVIQYALGRFELLSLIRGDPAAPAANDNDSDDNDNNNNNNDNNDNNDNDSDTNLTPFSVLNDILTKPTARLFSCRQRRRKFDLNLPGATGDRLHALLRKLYVEHNTQATLPRDRIYSLLDLAVDRAELGLKPDFTDQGLPEAEARMLTRAARAMIVANPSGTVDILCFAQFPKSLPLHLLPSWVPDWRGGLRPSFYSVNDVVAEHMFAACGGELRVRPVPYVRDDGSDLAGPLVDEESVLGLGGYLVDTIAAVAEGGAWDDMEWEGPTAAVRFLGFLRQVDALFERAMAREELPRLYRSQERRAEARWRVPIGDLYWTREEGTRRAPAEAVVYHRQAREFFEYIAVGAGLIAVEELERRIEEWNLSESAVTGRIERGEVGGFYRETMKLFVGKRPFVTTEGYLGMGPADAAAGDVVVVFCGGRIPFVLRPLCAAWREKRLFKYVGEAYCDGVMDGEVVERGEFSAFLLV